MVKSEKQTRGPLVTKSLCDHKDTITGVAFHPCPQRLLTTKKQNSSLDQIATSSLDGTLNIWNYSNDRKDDHVRVYRFSGHEGPVHNLSYSASGSLVASCSSDCTVRLWYPKASGDGKSVVFRGHSAPVKNVDFSSDQDDGGSFLLSCSDDKTLRLWDLQSPKQSFRGCLTGHNNWVNTCKFLPRSLQNVASGSDDGTLRLWDVTQGTNLLTYNVNAPRNSIKRGNSVNSLNPVRTIECHPSGSLIAASLGYGSVHMYDLRTDHLVHTFHDGAVNSAIPNCSNGIDFHPQGNHLLSGDSGGRFSLWDLRNNKSLFTVGETSNDQSCCSFSADGSKFAIAGGKNAYVWSSFDISSTRTSTCNSIEENDDKASISERMHVNVQSENVIESDSNRDRVQVEEVETSLSNEDDDTPTSKSEVNGISPSVLQSILSKINILGETLVLLEKRLTLQEEATKAILKSGGINDTYEYKNNSEKETR